MNKVPGSWKTVALAELCERLVDGSHNPPPAVESGKPMLSARNINDFRVLFDEYRFISESAFELENARTQVAPGDVLLTIVGTIGRTAVVAANHPPFALQRSVAVLKPRGISARYLAYALSSPEQQRWLTDNAKGTAQKGVYLKTLGTAEIHVAPLAEQTRIVAKLEELLSDLDAGVAELKAAQKKLAQYRQSLLKAAVEGALTAEWRTQHQPTETGAQLLQRILQERRARWEARQLAKFKEQGKTPPKDWQKKYPEPVQPDTTGLPVLPQGWVWALMDQLTEFITSGSRGWADYYSSSGATFIRSQNINKDRLDLTVIAFVNPPPSSEGARTRVHAHDLLLTITGANVGKAARVDIEIDEAYVSQHVSLIRPIEVEISDYLQMFLTSSAGGRGQLDKEVYGAGKPGLNLQQVAAVSVPVPGMLEIRVLMESVAMYLKSASDQEAAITASLQQSTAQRQNILRAAFSGQLVPQDPNDEPASVLLERIRAERAAQGAVKKPRGRKAKEAA